MYYVLLSGYNNYYNRIYKREDTIQEYIEASDGYFTFQDGMNFEYRDGISTEKLFNCEPFDGEPNYLLLKENATDTTPSSRWFVVEWVKIRGNQYKAILRRDLLADHYDAIANAPSFIEKGWVPSTDPAIFNKEDMDFNQIKQSEITLRDDSKTSWIVGYIANNATVTNGTFTYNPEFDVAYTVDFENWEYADIVDRQEHVTINPEDTNQYVKFWLYYNNVWTEKNKCYSFNKTNYSTYLENSRRDHFRISPDDWSNVPSNWHSYINWDSIISNAYADNPSWITASRYNTVAGLVGKVIKFNDGLYRISFGGAVYDQLDSTRWQNSGNLFSYISNLILTNYAPHGIESVDYYPVSYKMMLRHFTFTWEKLSEGGTYTYNITQGTRPLNDAPYKMFCIPYYRRTYNGKENYIFSFDGTTAVDCDPDLMLAWAMDIATALGGGGQNSQIYDLQILPYCPISNWSGINNTSQVGIWSKEKTEHWDYEYLTETVDGHTYGRGVISFCDVSSKEVLLREYGIVVGDYKISNQCYTYRLCSPNYASVFEFNAAMNDGVQGINVKFTYKPYQPYINIAPVFSRMYGKDFKDNRGLICSGDFSLPIVSSAWINYQLSNKNYLLAFDRQIENMEVQYGWQRKQGIANAITGTIQGGATGAMTGGMAGGVGGAIAGAVIGTVTSAVGGAMDLQMQQALHNEALDFSKDNFGYQLGNIKALPNTLNKVSSIVANSKFFPFLEIYMCTEEEKQALRDKIKYNGMSIGRIGKIVDFLNPSDTTYVKGQIIRLEGKFDTHTANEIANEFMKGWYI